MFWKNQLKLFIANRRGNVAIIFALSLIPLLAIAGFALDAQIAFGKKERVQQAADSAALAAARLMQVDSNQTNIQEKARKYFKAIIENGKGGLVCENVLVTYPSEDSLTVTADCTQETTLTGLLGREQIDFEVVSTATYGVGKVDVAFVFDISGSMNSYGRLADLKVAAKDAADTLLPETGSSAEGDVRIAMVSYNSMIDAGPFFEEVTGLKKNRTYVKNIMEDVEEEYTASEYQCGRPCEVYFWGYCLRYGSYQCDWVEVTKTRIVEKPVEKQYSMNSTCVFERNGSKAFSDTQPKQVHSSLLLSRVEAGSYNASQTSDNPDGYLTSAYAYWYEGNYNNSPGWRTKGTDCLDVQPFELSHNENQIKSYINSLKANGGTAGHQGIEWGWYLISENWSDVFDNSAEPLPYNEPDSSKAMIIMTDGEFNSQFHSSQGSSFNQAKAMCDAIKAKKVVIYTVAFGAPEEGEEVLEYCASGLEFAFKASNGEELLDSYQKIASSISDLRIQF